MHELCLACTDYRAERRAEQWRELKHAMRTTRISDEMSNNPQGLHLYTSAQPDTQLSALPQAASAVVAFRQRGSTLGYPHPQPIHTGGQGLQDTRTAQQRADESWCYCKEAGASSANHTLKRLAEEETRTASKEKDCLLAGSWGRRIYSMVFFSRMSAPAVPLTSGRV